MQAYAYHSFEDSNFVTVQSQSTASVPRTVHQSTPRTISQASARTDHQQAANTRTVHQQAANTRKVHQQAANKQQAANTRKVHQQAANPRAIIREHSAKQAVAQSAVARNTAPSNYNQTTSVGQQDMLDLFFTYEIYDDKKDYYSKAHATIAHYNPGNQMVRDSSPKQKLPLSKHNQHVPRAAKNKSPQTASIPKSKAVKDVLEAGLLNALFTEPISHTFTRVLTSTHPHQINRQHSASRNGSNRATNPVSRESSKQAIAKNSREGSKGNGNVFDSLETGLLSKLFQEINVPSHSSAPNRKLHSQDVSQKTNRSKTGHNSASRENQTHSTFSKASSPKHHSVSKHNQHVPRSAKNQNHQTPSSKSQAAKDFLEAGLLNALFTEPISNTPTQVVSPTQHHQITHKNSHSVSRENSNRVMNPVSKNSSQKSFAAVSPISKGNVFDSLELGLLSKLFRENTVPVFSSHNAAPAPALSLNQSVHDDHKQKSKKELKDHTEHFNESERKVQAKNVIRGQNSETPVYRSVVAQTNASNRQYKSNDVVRTSNYASKLESSKWLDLIQDGLLENLFHEKVQNRGHQQRSQTEHRANDAAQSSANSRHILKKNSPHSSRNKHSPNRRNNENDKEVLESGLLNNLFHEVPAPRTQGDRKNIPFDKAIKTPAVQKVHLGKKPRRSVQQRPKNNLVEILENGLLNSLFRELTQESNSPVNHPESAPAPRKSVQRASTNQRNSIKDRNPRRAVHARVKNNTEDFLEQGLLTTLFRESAPRNSYAYRLYEPKPLPRSNQRYENARSGLPVFVRPTVKSSEVPKSNRTTYPAKNSPKDSIRAPKSSVQQPLAFPLSLRNYEKQSQTSVQSRSGNLFGLTELFKEPEVKYSKMAAKIALPVKNAIKQSNGVLDVLGDNFIRDFFAVSVSKQTPRYITGNPTSTEKVFARLVAPQLPLFTRKANVDR